MHVIGREAGSGGEEERREEGVLGSGLCWMLHCYGSLWRVWARGLCLLGGWGCCFGTALRCGIGRARVQVLEAI